MRNPRTPQGNNPRARPRTYLKRHPGHVDALAHLCLAALEDGRREAVLWALQVGELLRAALEDAPDGPVPLPWERFENRPVLRLARNATLVMWEAQLWGLAERLVAYWERIDTTGEAAEWQAQISQRRVRPELTDA